MSFLLNPFIYTLVSGEPPVADYSDLLWQIDMDGPTTNTNLEDLSPYNRNIGNFDLTRSAISSKWGHAAGIEFTQTNEPRIEIPDAPEFNFDEPFTVEIRAKVDTTTGTAIRALIGKGGGDGSQDSLSLFVQNGALNLFLGTSASTDITGSVALSPGEHEIALTKDENNVYRVYLNGAVVITRTTSAWFDSTAPISIGASVNGHEPFDGVVYEARWWKGARYGATGYTPTTTKYTKPTGLPAFSVNSATARYWRLGWHKSWTGANPSASRIIFEDQNGIDVPAVGGTAISSGAFGGLPASNAFDGNNSTIWVSNATQPDSSDVVRWVGYDFGPGNQKTISGIRYRSRPDGYGVNEIPKIAAVQYSDDGTNWSTLFRILNDTPARTTGSWWRWRDWNRYSGGHRYWKLDVTANSGGSRTSYASLKLNVQDRSHIVAFDQIVREIEATTALDGSSSRLHAHDNFDSTSYGNLSGAASEMIVDFGPNNAPDIKSFDIQAVSQSWAPQESPKDFTFEYSDDGTNWTTAMTLTGQTFASSEIKKYVLP